MRYYTKSKQRTGAALMAAMLAFGSTCLSGCGNSSAQPDSPSPTAIPQTDTPSPTAIAAEDTPVPTSGTDSATPTKNPSEGDNTMDTNTDMLAAKFDGIALTEGYKKALYNNPVMTQRFGADPYALVYDGRVYLYMTGDIFEYETNGDIKSNSYGKINTICVLSSSDLVNWTDHGTIYAAGRNGAATWANNSWAPAAACKEIDGKMKFFLYFANSAGGIGVLTADSPVGPFTDPLGHALISRSTENCDNVTWLFDPAVLIDDDGRAYLYFGGGIPGEEFAHPYTARAVELGDDMISIVGTPVSIDPPYLFEDSGINKIGDTYYYSYCTNWHVDEAGAAEYGIKSAHIAYMTSDSPLGPFTFQGSIMKNPGEFFGCYGNNHHCMFEFNGQWYMTYHTQVLERSMGVDKGYRCTQIDLVSIGEDGAIAPITMTKAGIISAGHLNPYEKVQAETMHSMGGIETVQYGQQSTYFGSGNMIVTGIHTGDWLMVSGADFREEGAFAGGDDASGGESNSSGGNNASGGESSSAGSNNASGGESSSSGSNNSSGGEMTFTASVRASEGAYGIIKVCLDSPDGKAVAFLEVTPDGTTEFREQSCELTAPVSGSHKLYFIFYGENYELDYWYFQ